MHSLSLVSRRCLKMNCNVKIRYSSQQGQRNWFLFFMNNEIWKSHPYLTPTNRIQPLDPGSNLLDPGEITNCWLRSEIHLVKIRAKPVSATSCSAICLHLAVLWPWVSTHQLGLPQNSGCGDVLWDICPKIDS